MASGARDLAGVDGWRELRQNLRHDTGELLGSRLYLQYQMWFWPITARVQYGQAESVPYALILALHLFVLGAGLAGLLLTSRQGSSRLFLVIVVATALPYLVYYPEPRYALSAAPFLLVGAGCAVETVRRRLPAERFPVVLRHRLLGEARGQQAR